MFMHKDINAIDITEYFFFFFTFCLTFTTWCHIFSQASNELRPSQAEFPQLFSYTSCLAENELVLSFIKNATSV